MFVPDIVGQLDGSCRSRGDKKLEPTRVMASRYSALHAVSGAEKLALANRVALHLVLQQIHTTHDTAAKPHYKRY